jgi:hypothetical protein
VNAPATWKRGPWRCAGEEDLFEGAGPELGTAARERRGERSPRALGPFSSYYKGSPLDARHALRHAVRRAVRLAEVPRLQELANLAWLRERGFLAPRPLLAGVLERGGLPRFQFLFTELVPLAPTLAELFRAGPRERRGPALAALARDLARLHALGFVHRDLFARNLLVCATESGVRCAFLDAWRGGPGPALRGPEHDLGCLFLDGAALFAREEQVLFLSTYGEESSRAGRNLRRDWLARVARERRACHARESRRRPGLQPGWDIPALG